MHVRDEELRAFVDGQLDDVSRETVRVHLDVCASCRERLERLRAEAAALDEQLRPLAPGAAQRPRADRALARLHARIEKNYGPLMGGIMLKRAGLSRNWQRALGGLAAAVVVAVLFSFAPVRAAASGLLSIFRLERIVILPVSLRDIERLENASYELGSDFFPGDMDVLVEPGEPQYPATVGEASELVGFAVRAPATHPAADEIVVRGEMVTRYEPDLEKVRELFEAADLSPDLVPPEIDDQEFDLTMPVSVVQVWGDDDNALMVMQMPAPTVNFPEGVDEEALGVAMLQLLGLSPEEAEAMSASIDWTTTLLVPLPRDEMDFEPTTVDGTEGFLLTGTPSDSDIDVDYTALLWQKGGIVHVVAGIEDAGRMLEIANSLQ